MRTRDKISDYVIVAVSSHLGLPPGQQVNETDRLDDLGADSLDHTEIIMNVEDHYRIDIGDDFGQDQFVTIKDLVDYLERHVP